MPWTKPKGFLRKKSLRLEIENEGVTSVAPVDVAQELQKQVAPLRIRAQGFHSRKSDGEVLKGCEGLWPFAKLMNINPPSSDTPNSLTPNPQPSNPN